MTRRITPRQSFPVASCNVSPSLAPLLPARWCYWPTNRRAACDSKRSHEIMELLVRLNREQGITVIMVTHEPDMAAYASRIVHFVDGQVAQDERNGHAAEALPC